MTRLFFILAMLVFSPAVFALEPDERIENPVLEERARALGAELRCLVCQNQAIDDSASPFAKDVRLLVRRRLVAGDSDEEIRAFLVQRYGEFILLRPTARGINLFLWLFPLAAVAFASALAWWYYRRWRASSRTQ